MLIVVDANELFSAMIAKKVTLDLLFDKEDIKEFFKEACKISPDSDDIEYFALALKLNCPIWSEDKALKKQSIVKVYSTSELIKLLL